MVDWGLAEQIARFAAGSDEPVDLGADIPALVAQAEPEVAAHTRLSLARPVPEPELVGRREWARANLGTLSGLLDPVAARLDERLGSAGPLAGALRLGAGATLAAEAGLVLGYVSQRVLGQYELSLIQLEAPPRLLFVAPNLDNAVHDLEVDREAFIGWIVIHELTHVFQFQGVPWLRKYLAGLLREYMDSLEVRIERGTAGGLPSLPNLGELVERFREGGLAALVQTREQQELLDRIQAAMAVVEGYSEHVMDALGERMLPAWDGLREALERRRRSRSAPERVIQRLLGLDIKLLQYERGKSFCDAVAAEGGMDALNRVWLSQEALPGLSELSRPKDWLRRTAASPAAV
jgi:coenzyme F420 biosynthesis associated uncharacterized protein